jgi:hypothetical protein
MAAIDIPDGCILCKEPFEHKAGVIYISEATTFRNLHYHTPKKGEIIIRRRGGSAKKGAVHPACWMLAQSRWRNTGTIDNWDSFKPGDMKG